MVVREMLLENVRVEFNLKHANRRSCRSDKSRLMEQHCTLRALSIFQMWSGGGSGPTARLLSDADLVVRDGELMSGILDKAHIGPSAFGLVHCFHEAFGPRAATDLLSAITSVLNEFLKKVCFSLGIKDLLLTEKVRVLQFHF